MPTGVICAQVRLGRTGGGQLRQHLTGMTALCVVWYNFARINSAVRVSPAMAVNVIRKLWNTSDIVAIIDRATPAPQGAAPAKSGHRLMSARYIVHVMAVIGWLFAAVFAYALITLFGYLCVGFYSIRYSCSTKNLWISSSMKHSNR